MTVVNSCGVIVLDYYKGLPLSFLEKKFVENIDVDTEPGCALWVQKRINSDKTRRLCLQFSEGGKAYKLQARIIAFVLAHRSMPRRHMRVTCGNDLCVSPDHVIDGYTSSSTFAPYLSSTELAKRFSKIKKSYRKNGCVIWQGSTTSNKKRPYGLLKVSLCSRKSVDLLAHRVAHFLHTGIWPQKGQMVCHTCDITRCVAHEHLYLGDHESNMRDMVDRDRCNRSVKPRSEDMRQKAAEMRRIKSGYHTAASLASAKNRRKITGEKLQTLMHLYKQTYRYKKTRWKIGEPSMGAPTVQSLAKLFGVSGCCIMNTVDRELANKV